MDELDKRSQLICKLHDIGTVKFGSFILKSGTSSPVYVDFRSIISEPTLMLKVSELLWETTAAKRLSFVSLCGVPYTALPFATLISAQNNVPMLIRRKEAKSYGTKKMVEGCIVAGDVCLIIEDVVTTGSSIIETVEVLKADGVVVRDAVVLLDRQQGGRDNLQKLGVNLHSVFTMNEVLETLEKEKKVDRSTVEMVNSFLAGSQLSVQSVPVPEVTQKDSQEILPYSERAVRCNHVLAKRLFAIMNDKKTNLAVAADVTSCSQLLELAENVGPYICVLKTHADILSDFSVDSMSKLQQLAQKHNFLIFEDRKFADIGETVREQYTGGTLSISEWSDLVTIHSLPGPGIIKALKRVKPDRGCVIVAEMSSEGNLADKSYIHESVQLANENSDFVVGFVCQSRVSTDARFVCFTPGVHLDDNGDDLGQRYRSPHEAIVNGRCDVIIVGRGIRQAEDAAGMARKYRDAGYSAYQELLASVRH